MQAQDASAAHYKKTSRMTTEQCHRGSKRGYHEATTNSLTNQFSHPMRRRKKDGISNKPRPKRTTEQLREAYTERAGE